MNALIALFKFYKFSEQLLNRDMLNKRYSTFTIKNNTNIYNVNHSQIYPPGFKTFFMLNSAEYEIYPAHKW